ncbi:hypothetical protein GDO78_010158 [Eleutherodactylus coqui]|uniref:Uncharacterized protein n=1 Tax=Eleutherodactylus coqui TaxID=57060 RepID=A0A8J6K6R8_ELECQ|nr:hypothetical protein GDO78_010158 [Eleutherodactylus coqui]
MLYLMGLAAMSWGGGGHILLDIYCRYSSSNSCDILFSAQQVAPLFWDVLHVPLVPAVIPCLCAYNPFYRYHDVHFKCFSAQL